MLCEQKALAQSCAKYAFQQCRSSFNLKRDLQNTNSDLASQHGCVSQHDDFHAKASTMESIWQFHNIPAHAVHTKKPCPRDHWCMKQYCLQRRFAVLKVSVILQRPIKKHNHYQRSFCWTSLFSNLTSKMLQIQNFLSAHVTPQARVPPRVTVYTARMVTPSNSFTNYLQVLCRRRTWIANELLLRFVFHSQGSSLLACQ